MDRKKNLGSLLLLLLCTCLLLAPQGSMAATASKTAHGGTLTNVKVHLYGKSGDSEWFIAKTKYINKYGILEYKNVLPGWGRVKFAGEADLKQTSLANAGKTFTTKMRMLDDKGRKIKKPTPVDIYAKIGGEKHFVATIKTDSKGWLTVPHSMIGIESYLDVDGKGKKLGENNSDRPIVKVKAKMEGGDWFTALQKRLDEDRVLTLRNATSSKTEFKYVGKYDKITVSDLIDKLNEAGKLSDKLADKFKASDFAGNSFPKPFTLKVQVLDNDGHSIKKPTTVKMTVYLKHRTLTGNMRTNSEGWLTVKGVPVDIKTKMEVKD